jgi:peptidylprolyl isomerase
MRLATTLLLTFIPSVFSYAQVPTAKPAVHHAAATPAAKSALPPNIPRVPGVAKPLYSLSYIDIHVGTGPLAEPQKYYTVHYTGWLAKDGTKFDSSFDHPGQQPITFPYGAHRVMPGWDTGFEGMHVGGKRRLFIPWELAYGEYGHPPTIPAKADLIFDVELIGFSDTPPQPPPPPTPPPAAPEPPKAAPDQPKSTPPDPETPPASTTTQMSNHPESD